ncbi:DUF4268 domain-containing protein [Pedobacter sp. PWIIR3]
MYSKDETTKLRQEFWTAFGQYMNLQRSSDDQKINWINYKTGLKHLYFKMDADGKAASIAIEMRHPDIAIQELIFEQFKEFKTLLGASLGEEWHWQLNTTDEYGKSISRIFMAKEGISIFKKEDWPELIAFLKPRIIALDNFWNDAKDSFSLFA